MRDNISIYPFSHEECIAFIHKNLNSLKSNTLFRESFLQILLSKLPGKRECAEKIVKIPFSSRDMVETIYHALGDMEKYSDTIPFPQQINKKHPIANGIGSALYSYDLSFSLKTIALGNAFWHKDVVWNNACSFVWIAEDPPDVGSGTVLSLMETPPKGIYKRDENLEPDYVLETENLYFMNVSEPDGFLHGLSSLNKLSRLRNRVIVVMDIYQNHVVKQQYNWNKWKLITDNSDEMNDILGATVISIAPRLYSYHLTDRVMMETNEMLVRYFQQNAKQVSAGSNEFKIVWTPELQDQLNSLNKNREYYIYDEHIRTHFKPEKLTLNEDERIDALRESLPEHSTNELKQAVRGGTPVINWLLLQQLKKNTERDRVLETAPLGQSVSF